MIQLDQTEAAQSFLQSNRRNATLRRIVIRKHIANGNFQQARVLAKEGIDHDTEKYPGLAKEWYDWLLKMAIAEEDTGEVIRLARTLFFWRSGYEDKYYQVLKSHVPDTEWDSFVDGIVEQMYDAKYTSIHHLAALFIQEERWDQLWTLLQDDDALPTLSQYESHLPKAYASDVIEKYGSGIIAFMTDHTGRNHYQQVVTYLKRMLALGGREKVSAIIEMLSQKYPRRRALLEELRRIRTE